MTRRAQPDLADPAVTSQGLQRLRSDGNVCEVHDPPRL